MDSDLYIPKIGSEISNSQAMELAVSLAEQGVGYVSPNPPVGCVILDQDSKLIGYGYHEKFGGPHAEVNAISSVKDKAKLSGSKFFITLEPCGHKGKTPPCADAIVKVLAKKVYYAAKDPNPKVQGAGLKALTQNGIEQEHFQINNPFINTKLEEILEPFIYNQNSGQCLVNLKVASSLDGFIAKDTGESQWITCSEAREHVHFLRGQYDGILIGRGTVEIDNPKLNIRTSKFKGKRLKIVVFDPHLKLLKSKEQLNLFKIHRPEDIILVCDDQVNTPAASKFNFLKTKINTDGFNLDEVFLKLYTNFNIGSLFVEGGNRTYTQLLSQNKFQRLSLYIGSKILGADGSKSWTKGLNLPTLNDSIGLNLRYSEHVGQDTFILFSK